MATRTPFESPKTNPFTQCLPSRSPALVLLIKLFTTLVDLTFFMSLLCFFGLSYSHFRTLSLGHMGNSGMDTPRGKAGCFSFRLRRGASGRFLTFLLFGLHRYFLFTPDFSHQGVRCGVLLSAFLFRHPAGPVCSSRTRWSFLVSLLAPNLCPSSICFDLFDTF